MDQTTVKIIYTQEANEECNNIIYRKSNFIDSSGSNIRKIAKEAYQTFFVLTKEPPKENKRTLSKEDKTYFINFDPNSITFEKLIEWFGNTTDITEGKNTNRKVSKFKPTDILTLNKNEYSLVKSDTPITTTLGRLIFNKVMIEKLGFSNLFEYQNDVMIAKRYGAFEGVISSALREDIIDTRAMIKYIDNRDWFGLQLHGIITSSFTPGVLKVPESVKKLKAELLEKYKDEIAKGDIRVVEEIEKQLLKAMTEELKDDIGMDLYLSGARGSINNHLKNMFLIRGAVQNTVTNQFDIIENSLMDGLAKKDVPTHSNMIVAGAYPKAF